MEVVARELWSGVWSLRLDAIAIALAAGLLLRASRSGAGRVPGLVIGLIASAGILRSSFVGFAMVGALVYLAAAPLEKIQPSGPERLRRWRLGLWLLLVLIAGYVLLRLFPLPSLVLNGSLDPLTFAIDMWTVLRLTTFIWEVGSSRVRLPAPLDFARWYVLPFTVIGPVLRYSELEALRAGGQPVPDDHRRLAGWVTAALKLAAATVLIAAGGWLLHASSGWRLTAVKGLHVFLIGPWSFYLTSAGYFQFMELCGSVAGLRLPASYDAPFGRVNLAEFWARWNMTATRVFRDYLFMNRWGMRRVSLPFNAFVVFVVVGAWHGPNGYWLLWGALHGLGFAAFLIYRAQAARWKWLTTLTASPAVDAIATYVFVCLCWYLPSKILVRM